MAHVGAPGADALKLSVELDGREYTIDIRSENGRSEYTLQGEHASSGTGSVVRVAPGVFSVLLDGRSFTVRTVHNGDEVRVWTSSGQHTISIADTRDQSGGHRRTTASGPMELRAQMPGKVIKLLVENGSAVQAGQGLIVVEAMKMQNEMKSPKDGTVTKIHVMEGATVTAGQALIVVE